MATTRPACAKLQKKPVSAWGTYIITSRARRPFWAEIAALDRQETQPFLDILADDEQPEATLLRFISAYADHAALPENVIFSIELVSESIHNPEIAALFNDNWASLVGAVSSLLNKGMADGCFREFSNPDETAEMIMDLLESLGLRLYFADGGKKKDAAIDDLKEFVRCAIRPPVAR